MAFTFYRKYRPARFADIIGQEAVVQTLENSLIQERISHAYLLTGPRGTGKTTLARLFGKAVNCSNRKGKDFEPCGKCVHCTSQEEGRSLDIIEIDAASHTGVDNIRELRETIHLAPTLGKYKVYIIDEAHMLSLGAWNALLKTLEEPPAHVIFILATTNVGKVPETILSRTMRFDLSRFPVDKIIEKLEKIAKAEKIKISRAALSLIARAAQGGMRDAESLFTQIATLEKSPIEESRVALLLGATNFATLEKLLLAVADNDLTTGLNLLQKVKNKGANLTSLAHALLEYLRHLLFAALDPIGSEKLITDMTEEEKVALVALAKKLGSERIVEALEHFQEAEYAMKTASIPELPLEIALAKLITVSKKATPDDDIPSNGQPTSAEKTKSTSNQETTKSPVKKSLASKNLATISIEESRAPINFNLIREHWQQIVAHVKERNASVGVALSSAIPSEIRDNRLILKVKYPFHKERLEEKAHQLTLGQAFDTILGFRVAWRAEVEKKKELVADTPHAPIIDQALEMLGGKLVSENN